MCRLVETLPELTNGIPLIFNENYAAYIILKLA